MALMDSTARVLELTGGAQVRFLRREARVHPLGLDKFFRRVTRNPLVAHANSSMAIGFRSAGARVSMGGTRAPSGGNGAVSPIRKEGKTSQSLKRAERETVILMDDASDVARITTHQRRVLTALRKNPAARELRDVSVGTSRGAEFELPADLVAFRTRRRRPNAGSFRKALSGDDAA